MSKLKMLRFEAAALQKKGKGLIECLQKSGICHIEKKDDDRLFVTSTVDTVNLYEKYVHSIQLSMDILKEYGLNFAPGMFSGRKEFDDKTFEDMSKHVLEGYETSIKIQKHHRKLSDYDGKISQYSTLVDTLRAWEGIDIPLGGVVTEETKLFAGSFPCEYTLSALKELIGEGIPHVNEYDVNIVYSSKQITSVVFVCHKSCYEELMQFLRSLSFALPGLDLSDVNVSEKIKELNENIALCLEKKQKSYDEINSLKEKAELLKFSYDYFLIKADEYRALSDVAFSDRTIYIAGFVAERDKDRLLKIVEKSKGAVVFSEPDEDDDVPVLLSNGAFSEPVESIVEMYATPSKSDIDPSKVMAFFYYLLFGMMLSDAGYGLVLGLGSFLLLKCTSVEGSMRKMLKMFVYCGISTVFWGALFGSWFGDAIPLIAREFFGKELSGVALWFDPLEKPITLLLFSFVIGICHLFLGLSALFYMKWKEGDKISAICDTIPIMLTVTGAAPLAAGVLVNVPSSVTGVAQYVAIVGVILIVLTSARSGNIILRLGGGLYALYNIASGYLSDILSYSRLLALGLATGCIGSVVNMLAVMVKTPGIKVVVFILVFIVGHTLNMAINVLGAYVHTNRLQFVELFSKFYEGGGKSFSPFSINTKFFKFKEENKND